MATMRRDPQLDMTRQGRWREAFHAREVSTLPRKLRAWVPHIDTKALSGTSPQQIQAVVTSMQGLTYRMQELLEERGNPQAQFLVQELLADIRAWRLRVQEAFQRLSEDPAAGERETFRSKIDGILDQLEERIKGTLNKAPEGKFSDRDGENFYRLLGAYRGVSEALVNYAGSANTIDWAQWKKKGSKGVLGSEFGASTFGLRPHKQGSGLFKDERPTLNVELPTSNKSPPSANSVFDFIKLEERSDNHIES